MSVPFPPMKRPLVAILRGVKPDETDAIVGVLIEAGMTAIEIPLNSPDPFRSIGIAAKRAPAGILIGAGTVLSAQDVDRLSLFRLHAAQDRDQRSLHRRKWHAHQSSPQLVQIARAAIERPRRTASSASIGSTATDIVSNASR